MAGGEARVGTDPEVVAEFTVANRHGLHARPAARLVSEMRDLDAAGPAAQPDHRCRPGTRRRALAGSRRSAHCTATGFRSVPRGPQAPEAIEQLLALAARHFDEPPEERVQPPARATRRGTAAGLARHRHRAGPQVRGRHLRLPTSPQPASPAAEWRRVVEARGRGSARDRTVRAVASRGRASGGADLRRPPDAARRRGTARRRQGPGRLRGRCASLRGPKRSRWSRSNGRTCPIPTCAPARRTSEPSRRSCSPRSPAPLRSP